MYGCFVFEKLPVHFVLASRIRIRIRIRAMIDRIESRIFRLLNRIDRYWPSASDIWFLCSLGAFEQHKINRFPSCHKQAPID